MRDSVTGNSVEGEMKPSRRWPRAILLAVGLLVPPLITETQQGPSEPFDLITHMVVAPNAESWRIDRPNVRQNFTPYTGIPLTAGDVLTLQAGGCVQTGGAGAT